MDKVDEGNRYATQMIDQKIANRVRYTGTSRQTCIDCEDPIPEGRRLSISGCKRCTSCEEDHAQRARR